MSEAFIKVNWSQVATSLLIGGIVGAIAIIRLSDSQQIVIAGQAKELDELKGVIVPRGEYEQAILRIDQRLQYIEQNSQQTNNKLDRLLER